MSGSDAAQFLQAQLTSDVVSLAHGRWQWSGYCNPKGRLLATFRVARTRTDDYELEVPRVIAETLVARLKRYVLRAKVTLRTHDSDRFGVGIAGEPAASVLRKPLASDRLPGMNDFVSIGEYIVFGLETGRFHCYASLDRAKTLWTSLTQQSGTACAPNWHRTDIALGRPWIYSETQELFVPQMVDLDLIGGVSFDKGCYPGQEIVARSRYLGEVKRRLHHARASGEHAPRRGELVRSDAGPVGHVLNAAPTSQGDYELLVVIDSDAAAAPELILADSGARLNHVQRQPAPV